MLPVFKDELVVDRGATIQVRPSLEALRRESQELEIQIKQLQVGPAEICSVSVPFCCCCFLHVCSGHVLRSVLQFSDPPRCVSF